MRYLSVCSGIEAASVAWHDLGWTPLAFSEIEPFPRAVLQHHYPQVPLHGDFTVLRDQPWIVDADILVGGTPCQAFSVAGLRNSLSDERGNLSLEFVRLADAIDNHRRMAGKDSAIIVWENVPGVLSVKDNAFGCFLAGLAGDVTPYVPPRGKWTNAGVVDGPQRSVAWRILDAQYFGLAQRRRRVFVVASARAGFDPAAVLLEFEGVRRDTPPRREAGQAVAGTIEASLGRSRGAGTPPGALSHWDGVDHPHPTLNQSAKSSGGVGASNQELFSQRGAYLVGDVTTARMVAFGEYSDDGTASTLKSRDYKDATDLVTHSLRAEGFDASEDGTGRGTPLVPVRTLSERMKGRRPVECNFAEEFGVPAFPLQEVGKRTGTSTTDPRAGLGIGEDGDPMYTLQAGAQHGVAYPLDLRNAGRDPDKRDALNRQGLGIGEDGEPSPTISTAFVPGVAAYAFQPRIARNGRGDMGEVVNALNAQSGETGKGDAAPCVAFSVNAQADQLPGVGRNVSISDSLTASQNAGVAQHMAVRRLTPVECERLQGFPYGYTNIPWRGKPEAPDGPRYKALGNSMAVPVMRWIGRRIANAIA